MADNMTIGNINRRMRELRDQASKPDADEVAIMEELQRLMDAKRGILRALGGRVIKEFTR